jgi:hypothetical protein
VKSTIVCGDTLDFLTTVTGYPPADGWTFKHLLVPRFTSPAQAPITLTATTSGDDYRTQAGPSTTENWAAGAYAWWSWVEKTGYRQEVDFGQVDLLPDPSAQVAGYDGRSQAAKAVDDLKLALATYTASQGHIAEYTINNRSLKFKSAGDIVQLLNFWQLELQREEAAAAVAKGLPDPRRIYLRASRA